MMTCSRIHAKIPMSPHRPNNSLSGPVGGLVEEFCNSDCLQRPNFLRHPIPHAYRYTSYRRESAGKKIKSSTDLVLAFPFHPFLPTSSSSTEAGPERLRARRAGAATPGAHQLHAPLGGGNTRIGPKGGRPDGQRRKEHWRKWNIRC